MPTPDVGKDIESICGKCGDVWHVVVAKVGDKIAKVVCKQCGGQHRYRPPDGAQPARSPRRAAGTTTRKTSAGGRKAKPKPTPASPEPLVQPDLSRPTRPYRLDDSYAVAERIDHVKFGVGIVEAVVGRGKIQVFFPDCRRVMAHERKST